MIEIKIDNSGVLDAFNRLLQLGGDMSPIMEKIAGVMKDHTEENFASQSGPLGAWPALKDKKRADGMILQDTGRLAESITVSHNHNSASIGTNVIYARIHQLGGTIKKDGSLSVVRHRVDRKGNLMHSEHLGGKGLIFAKNSHKLAMERLFAIPAHDINIPARPFLPVTPDGHLQDGVEQDIVEVVNEHLRRMIEA